MKRKLQAIPLVNKGYSNPNPAAYKKDRIP